jgi:hypothetical protein
VGEIETHTAQLLYCISAAVAAAAARGVLPTLLGILPYAGLKFYVYQAMKNHYRAGSFSSSSSSSSSSDHAASQLAQQQQQQLQQQQAVPVALESISIVSSNVAVAEAADCSLALTAANTLLSDGDSQQQHAGQQQHQQQTLDDMQQEQQPPQKLPVLATLVFGGLAGLVAQTVTYPLVSIVNA